MRRRLKKRNLYLNIIIVAYLSIAIGYALISSTITINGTTEVTGNNWDIHFENFKVDNHNSTGSVGSLNTSEDKTLLNFSKLEFKNPGDEIVFYVDVVNAGTIDGKLDEVIQTTLTEKQQKYFTYQVSYAYNQKFVKGDILKAGKSERVRILIKYNDSKTDAPTEEQTIANLNFKLKYVQDDRYGRNRKRLCRRATTLHSEDCTSSANSTNKTGFCYLVGTSITYGQIGSSGTLASGDAFDCDVNNDGVYNPTNERFYYVTDLDSETAVLISYNNSSSKGSTPNVAPPYYSSSTSTSYLGPITAASCLPTKSAWSGVGLINDTPQIYNEEGGTTVTYGPSNNPYVENLPKYKFTSAASLLTLPEFEKITDKNIFFENFGGQTGAPSCLWLNTPCSTCGGAYVFAIEYYSSTKTFRIITKLAGSAPCGARPVIEVLKNDMDY